MTDLAVRELLHPAEDPVPEIAAERHRDLRTEVHRADRAQDLRQRDGQHDAAGRQDVVRVAEDHALVDDVGVERRQVQRRQRLRQLQQQDERERLAVGPQVAAHQSDQHGSVSGGILAGNGVGRTSAAA